MSAFFLLSMSIGILQFAENLKLYFQKGEQLLLDYSFSLIEVLWLLVSFWFLFKPNMPLYGYMAISIFIGYHIFGWLVGFRAMQLADETESDDIVIPPWYFQVNMVICPIYAFVGYLALGQVNA